jgi:AcrR family transcriptional regulator
MRDMRFDAGFAESPVSQRVLQKEYTRRRILDMAVALMRNCGEEAVTIRAVAFEADVTERTVYRHFKSRDALLQAVWRRLQELIGSAALPETADALVERPRLLFPRLDRERELVRALVHRRARGVGRKRLNEKRQQEIMACVREELEYLDERSLRRRAAIAQLIASPYGWQYLEEFWGMKGKEAAQAAAEALEILLNRRLAY